MLSWFCIFEALPVGHGKTQTSDKCEMHWSLEGRSWAALPYSPSESWIFRMKVLHRITCSDDKYLTLGLLWDQEKNYQRIELKLFSVKKCDNWLLHHENKADENNWNTKMFKEFKMTSGTRREQAESWFKKRIREMFNTIICTDWHKQKRWSSIINIKLEFGTTLLLKPHHVSKVNTIVSLTYTWCVKGQTQHKGRPKAHKKLPEKVKQKEWYTNILMYPTRNIIIGYVLSEAVLRESHLKHYQ
jgi:hypothetical protein